MDEIKMNYEFCDGFTHTIRKGDTLYEISRKHNVPLALLLRANPYVDVFNLQVGDTICIPVQKAETIPFPVDTISAPDSAKKDMNVENNNETKWTKYVVKPGDTLADVIKLMSGTVEEFMKQNKYENIYLLPGVAYYIETKK